MMRCYFLLSILATANAFGGNITPYEVHSPTLVPGIGMRTHAHAFAIVSTKISLWMPTCLMN